MTTDDTPTPGSNLDLDRLPWLVLAAVDAMPEDLASMWRERIEASPFTTSIERFDRHGWATVRVDGDQVCQLHRRLFTVGRGPARIMVNGRPRLVALAHTDDEPDPLEMYTHLGEVFRLDPERVEAITLATLAEQSESVQHALVEPLRRGEVDVHSPDGEGYLTVVVGGTPLVRCHWTRLRSPNRG